MKSQLRRLMRTVGGMFLLLTAPALWLVSCQSKLIYYPRPYPVGTVETWKQRTQGTPIEFTTSQGRQQAFLQGNLTTPRNLWIVCGGNATVALDWSEWLTIHAPAEDAWLLVDLPGYGSCEGSPNPERILESFRTVLPLARERVGLNRSADLQRLRFFGHSLGAAAVLSAAADAGIQRGVITAPFTSTMDMAKEMIGLPVGFLVTHRFDNMARIAEISAREGTRILVVHGSDDSVIPVRMGRALAAGREPKVTLKEVPGGGHNDLTSRFPEILADALRIAGGC